MLSILTIHNMYDISATLGVSGETYILCIALFDEVVSLREDITLKFTLTCSCCDYWFTVLQLTQGYTVCSTLPTIFHELSTYCLQCIDQVLCDLGHLTRRWWSLFMNTDHNEFVNNADAEGHFQSLATQLLYGDELTQRLPEKGLIIAGFFFSCLLIILTERSRHE